MIITKLALPRRTFLRGTSVALAMPLLDAMVPALSALARSAAAPVPRLAICGMSNGIYRPTFRPPSGGETDFTMSRTLAPLAPFRDQLVIVDGLSNAAADTAESAGGPHARANSTFLTGVRAKRTEGADVHLGKSFDQYAADTLGVETPLRSLELQLESSYSGICDTGYSCAYTNTYAWRTATQPLPMEINPRMVFERLFGDAGSVKAQQIQMRRDRSVLDWVQGELSGLQKRLGASDQHTLNDYLDSVRDVELRIQKAEKRSETTELPEVIKPRGIPDTVDEHVKLMFDLQLLAFQADITRVVTFQMTREQATTTYPELGVTDGHHNISHHGSNPANYEQQTKLHTYFVSQVARFAEKLRATPDGDGNLLDHAMVMYSAALGDGDAHSVHNLPVAIVGGGCGQLRGGRYMEYELDTPFMNLGLTLLDKVGAHVDAIGDSTGRLANL